MDVELPKLADSGVGQPLRGFPPSPLPVTPQVWRRLDLPWHSARQSRASASGLGSAP
jgi:hypothetical protein